MTTTAWDVLTAQHDDVKGGWNGRGTWSRVIVAAPTWEEAMTVAAEMAVARHGGMPLRVLARF